MMYAGRNPQGQRIVGKLYRKYDSGITIEYENGVREFINNSRVEGPIKEERKHDNDLFGPT